MRYYSPNQGRFLGRDPKQEAGGLNLYGFCRNNSINLWDVLGMEPEFPASAGAMATEWEQIQPGVWGWVTYRAVWTGDLDASDQKEYEWIPYGPPVGGAETRGMAEPGQGAVLGTAFGFVVVAPAIPSVSVTIVSQPTIRLQIGFESTAAPTDTLIGSLTTSVNFINNTLKSAGLGITVVAEYDLSPKTAPPGGDYTFDVIPGTDDWTNVAATINLSSIRTPSGTGTRVLVTNSSIQQKTALGFASRDGILVDGSAVGTYIALLAHELGHIGGYHVNDNPANDIHQPVGAGYIMDAEASSIGLQADLGWLEAMRRLVGGP